MRISNAEAAALLNQVDGRAVDYTGHYHHNYRVHTSEGDALLRRRRPDVHQGYDPRMLPEVDALEAAAMTGALVPAVLYADEQCLIERFIGGTHASLTNEDVTNWLPGLLNQVKRVHSRQMSRPPVHTVYDWQIWLRDFFADLYESVPNHHAVRLAALQLPPITDIWVPERHQTERVLTLVHSDLTPPNLLINDQGVWILDWELAMAGDPVWDAAVSLHRTPWPTADAETAATTLWLDVLEEVPNAAEALRQYRSLEVWKSLVVDSARFPELVAADPKRLDDRAERLHGLIVTAAKSFGSANLSLTDTRNLLSEWATNTARES
jgi:thiamine kinase-like enzyme